MDKVFCPDCRAMVEYRVEDRSETHNVRGEQITAPVRVGVCSQCGADLAVDALDDELFTSVYREYRSRHGLLQPEEIKALRTRYGLGQKAFARLLGWGDVTLARYEAGSLQSEAHDSALRLAEDPANVRRLLDRNGDRLTPEQRAAVEERLPALTAGRDVMLAREDSATYGADPVARKLEEMIVFFAARPWMWRTKLNKMLFYADFLHVKRHGVPISGASYVRMQFGPVPAGFYETQARLVRDGSIDEVPADDGDCSGTLFVTSREPHDVFTDDELETMRFVAAHFERWSAGRISRYSHEEPAWSETGEREAIPYVYAEKLRLT